MPRNCDIGAKTNSNGHLQYWRGFKLHWDVADGQIPISAVLTSASVHDSQVAISLATMTAQRVTSLYDLMDSAYDAAAIHEHSRELGHKPIVDPANRGRKTKNVVALGKQARQFTWAEAERYKERTLIERANGRLKDEFGGRFIRVRGPVKVAAHLMFGVLTLTVDQLLRLTAVQNRQKSGSPCCKRGLYVRGTGISKWGLPVRVSFSCPRPPPSELGRD